MKILIRLVGVSLVVISIIIFLPDSAAQKPQTEKIIVEKVEISDGSLVLPESSELKVFQPTNRISKNELMMMFVMLGTICVSGFLLFSILIFLFRPQANHKYQPLIPRKKELETNSEDLG